MLITRAPMRVSFFGGGTDIQAYYLQNGGAVLSTTIDKYVYVILNVNSRDGLQISSSDYRTFYRHPPDEPLLWDGDLSLPRAVLQHFGVTHGVSMFLASEVPPGTGLGSSSAVTVALIKSVSTACGHRLTKAQLAELACYIEIDKLQKPIGLQDQYAAAFGGLNWISFSADGVQVERVPVAAETVARLESNLLLAFTGATHDSAHILSEQTQSSRSGNTRVMSSLHAVHELALEARELLTQGHLSEFGRLLDRGWQFKKRFATGVSNTYIDHCYEVAKRNGVLGGKIAGAGGGGFLLLYCEDGTKERVSQALTAEGLRRMDVHFESDGARVLFNAGLRLDTAGGAEPGATLGNVEERWLREPGRN
jgi:D-glycero-alpha-D-manno-heptose-7-phosphate kinase